MKILGVFRETQFSNNAVKEDREILTSVINVLNKQFLNLKCTKLIEASELRYETSIYDIIFSMAQEPENILILEKLERNGTIVLNSPLSIRNCFRVRLSEKLKEYSIPYPKFKKINISQKEKNHFKLDKGGWIKRGDFHSLDDEDVSFVSSVQEFERCLNNFSAKGVEEIIFQENVYGELYKFYGVRDSFFDLKYFGKTKKERFGQTNEIPEYPINESEIKKIAFNISNVLDLDFFGGDFIVTKNGELFFIDINDWPSYRSCKNEVAPIIAHYGLSKFNQGHRNVQLCINSI